MCPAARLAAVFVLLAVSSALAQPKPEPEYQGKKGSVWVETLLNDSSSRQRALAAIALGKLWAEHRYEPALPTLGRAIRVDASPAVRVQALSVVAGMDPLDVKKKVGDDKRSLADDLVQALESEKEPRVRRELAVTVGLFSDVARRGVDPLIGYLKDADPATRAAAATALGRIGSPAKEAVADLLPLLKDPETAVRRSAAFALGRVSVEDSAAASAL
ncbi:MAG TPA: HEAT repeat domain-containing protein, partial [Gemmataceae bacterium]|nr:HEAT repeat domain-containing protein [Gemmataceae bacterium]